MWRTYPFTNCQSNGCDKVIHMKISKIVIQLNHIDYLHFTPSFLRFFAAPLDACTKVFLRTASRFLQTLSPTRLKNLFPCSVSILRSYVEQVIPSNTNTYLVLENHCLTAGLYLISSAQRSMWKMFHISICQLKLGPGVWVGVVHRKHHGSQKLLGRN